MAMKNCFQLSTISTATRAGVAAHSNHYPFSSKEKVMRSSTTISFSSSSSSSFAPSSLNTRDSCSSRVVCKASVDEVKVATESNWNSLVVECETPVLVEFWAPWCGPCRMIAPVVDELAKEYAGKILCFKLNTDDHPAIASEYGIRSIPTVLFFKGGEKKESVIGAVPKTTLTATIEKYLE